MTESTGACYNGYEDYFDKKVILTVAVTGGRHGKDKNPNIPYTPTEVAEDVRRCEEAGASIVHLHARDDEGNPTKDPSRYQELQDQIKQRCDNIIVNFTTGEAFSFSPEERLKPLLEVEPKPELASLDMGPLNVGDEGTAPSTRKEIVRFAEIMTDNGIKPEIELFHQGQLTELNHLIRNDIISPPYFCNVISGMQTSTIPSPQNVINFVENLPQRTIWNCMSIGRHQLPITTLGLILGGHVRVGLEDNIYYRKGELATSNAQLVERAACIAETLERSIATPTEAREMLNL